MVILVISHLEQPIQENQELLVIFILILVMLRMVMLVHFIYRLDILILVREEILSSVEVYRQYQKG